MYARMFLMAVIVCCAMTTNAQFGKIPGYVTDTLKVRFPGASDVTWNNKFSGYQANFKVSGDKIKASFNKRGEWQETERNFDFSKLPADVKDGFKKSKYADWPVKEVAEINTREKGLQYRVLVKSSSKRFLYFSSKGQLQKDGVSF